MEFETLETSDASNNLKSARPTITPFLVVKDGKRAVEFYVAGFGATESVR